ncbi:hypothetical protein ILUMI_05126 [Ignelater luminosus]|uniref:Phosphatidylserine decarboxylase proenzyme, mitochondrial n=1 Tax=Ignelater luminosus TaxID=2038154 RepID=A0A8K0D7P7_IGNLU|nr:hypothetical protein ILUMI_05126 [Ignelater luminosus]
MSLYILTSIKLIPGPIQQARLVSPISRLNWRFSLLNQKTNYVKWFSTGRGKIREWSTWKGIITRFVPIGLCLIAVMQWRAYRKFSADHTAKNWEVIFYCSLPLRATSRCWGWIADKRLPESLRPYIYGLYSNTFGVNLSEAAEEDFKSYPSLADFFARALKEGVRIIDPTSCLVSPCDGTVLHFGPVNTGQVEQVKGITYSLEKFLGENTWNRSNNNGDYRTSLLHKSDKQSCLYQCIIYLAPGDYHRFHSPTEWQPTHRRHFTGELLSVNPSVARWLPGLFCLNERAVYLGQWAFGFFSMTAVGATNVGTVKVYFDKALQTNRPKYKQSYLWKDKCFGSTVLLKKGDPFGEFRMGSTIVLLFEAPASFRFNLTPGQRVQMGQAICCAAKEGHVDRVQKPTYSVISNAS